MSRPLSVRWMIRRDLPEVLVIERASFEFAWDKEDFLAALRQRNCIGMLAERDGRVAGFMVYELHKGQLRLLNFAVHPACRRAGVATAMVRRLVEKLSPVSRKEILLEVRETNLDAQCFFRAMGFLAIEIRRGSYDDTDEDAYLMRYGLDDEVPVRKFDPRNRISNLFESEAR